MADSGSGDKTEKPSAQKLRKARSKGQVVRSRDWAAAVGLLVALKTLLWLMPGWLEDFRHLFVAGFAPLDGEGNFDNAHSDALGTTIMLIIKMVAPMAAVPLIVSLASLLPGGWAPSVDNLMPKLSRMSPISNLGRLFGGKHWADFATALGKAIVLLLVMWFVLRSQLPHYMALSSQSFDQALMNGSALMVDTILTMVIVFVVFAFIDLPVQIFFFMRQQRMTKHEVKEEHKGNEGRPEVKQRIRQLQQQMTRRSVRKAVPGADVVVMNPDHYAVALKYDDQRAEAPFLVAKGMDEMAFFIRDLARQHGVQVLTLPPLARAIYHTSQVNQQIPAALYRAVALVLGYVMQMRAFQAGRRKAEPTLPTELDIPPQLSHMAPPAA